MKFSFVVDVEVERAGRGKFASREEIAEKILEHLNEEPDVSGCGPDGDTDYDVTSCDASEVDPAVTKRLHDIRAALAALAHEAVAMHNVAVNYPKLFPMTSTTRRGIAKLARRVNGLKPGTFRIADRAYVTRAENDRRVPGSVKPTLPSEVVIGERRVSNRRANV